jgi:hypothetical protein
MDNSDLIEENREALETVANADLPASWVAEELLQSIEGDSSEKVNDPPRTDTEATIEPNKPSEEEEPKGSIFAY